MTAYLVTKYSIVGDYDEVLAALETRLETVDNSKAIYLCSVVPRGNEFVGLLIYAA
jgi:hypothetical protein